MVNFPPIFDEAISRLSNIETAFTSFAEMTVSDPKFTEWLLAFNLDEIYEGHRPDGTEIEKIPAPWQYSPKYEQATINAKKVKGQVYDRVTLKDTGAFYDAAKVNVTGSQQIRIEDSDPKTDQIIATWGLVLGVSSENLANFIEIIRPEFFKFAEEYFK